MDNSVVIPSRIMTIYMKDFTAPVTIRHVYKQLKIRQVDCTCFDLTNDETISRLQDIAKSGKVEEFVGLARVYEVEHAGDLVWRLLRPDMDTKKGTAHEIFTYFGESLRLHACIRIFIGPQSYGGKLLTLARTLEEILMAETDRDSAA